MFDAYDIFVERSSPLFQEFLTQNPEMANAPLKDQFITFITNRSIVYHLGNVSETLFFVMCSMLIVDIVDKHGGFRAVTGYIRTPNKRKLLWYISFATFFFSALLDNLAAAIVIMAVLNFLVGWFNGMGWPPCGRVMTHWFSVKERGTKMSIWNCAHNVGGALVGPMAVYGAMWFGSWFYGVDSSKYLSLIHI